MQIRELLKIRKLLKQAIYLCRKQYYLSKCASSAPGTIEWLVGSEIKYGGISKKVPRAKVSPKDPRSKKQLRIGGMVGGDRMFHHGYAKKYSEYLLPFVKKDHPLTLAEFGILKGTGLAIWCDLFQQARIIGFDIDLGHIHANMENLQALGAFEKNRPELYEYDQFIDNTAYLGTVLQGDPISICIDDGFHSIETILTTLKSVAPYLADDFVYFIEDNKYVHKQIGDLYPSFSIDSAGEMTVVSKSNA